MSASPLQSFIAYKAETKSQCGNYRIDVTPPKEGEQYRFHFDATACVGCRCCEAACNEQNGNPANVKWRRVGEMEAGEFPNSKTKSISFVFSILLIFCIPTSENE